MKYGLTLPNAGVDPKVLVEFAALAEQAGWQGVFLEDYIMWQGHLDVPTYDPWTLMSAMAQRTQTVLLGTTVTPLARRRPWKVAAELVTLDHLSNGRMILGVGLGDNVTDDISFKRFGEVTDPRQRAGMLDEALEILVGLWRGETFSFQGKYYHLDNVRLLPKPVQQPRIPIWVGGAYPLKGPLHRAARWDGACMYKHKTHYMMPADLRGLKEFVEAKRVASGPYEIACGGSPRGEDWEKERDYIRSLAEVGMTWWMEYVPPDEQDAMRKCIERGPLRIDSD